MYIIIIITLLIIRIVQHAGLDHFRVDYRIRFWHKSADQCAPGPVERQKLFIEKWTEFFRFPRNTVRQTTGWRSPVRGIIK